MRIAIVGSLLVFAATTAGFGDAPTADDAQRFLAAAQERLLELQVRAERAAWVQANFITFDTQQLAAEAEAEWTAATVELAKEASRFSAIELPAETRRLLRRLELKLDLPAPADREKGRELARISTELSAMYGSGKSCRQGAEGEECQSLGDFEAILAESRDPAVLLDAWTRWRTVSPPMRPLYERFVELGNEGARGLGFRDLGDMWRAGYDMPADEFAAELDRLWGQVKPLYEALHCHVRARLNEAYGDAVAPPHGPIPAHLLGNMWAQDWDHVFELVAPVDTDPGFDLSERLQAKGLDAREMVRYGERFFTSLGFSPLPETFWQRSLFVKPRDREVVCHASAWDIDEVEDLRIKMCIDVDAEDFQTIHHELGHNIYQRAYNQQPLLFRDSANDGFHEAVGDTIALSVTPSYLVQVGLLDEEPPIDKDIGLLLHAALGKVAFLPFGLLIDQWRWGVFSGRIQPGAYNDAWWDLRLRYQGITPPVPRSEADFDPGAKYHVPANTPYTRYFLAHILQFQFHRSLCQLAGFEGPLHRCSIYGNEAAGKALNAMLELGMSRPWQEALAALTGTPQMDASAILDYFSPLQTWLDEQNASRQCGW